MAKKSKRQSRKSARGSARANSSRGEALTIDRDFNPDYSQTIRDLRRIAMLAGSFFVILIILSFILR